MLQEDLASHADAKQRLVLPDMGLQHVVHAAAPQVAHGLTGGAHTGKDDALRPGDGVRVAGDLAGDAQVAQRPEHGSLVSGFVVENGQHRDSSEDRDQGGTLKSTFDRKGQGKPSARAETWLESGAVCCMKPPSHTNFSLGVAG
jgi:hypothetical protein